MAGLVLVQGIAVNRPPVIRHVYGGSSLLFCDRVCLSVSLSFQTVNVTVFLGLSPPLGGTGWPEWPGLAYFPPSRE